MPDPNPVRAKLAPLADGTLSLRPGYGAAPQPVQVKAGPMGALQAFYSYTAAEEADLQIANTVAVDANTVGISDLTTQVKGLGDLVKAQTDAVKALALKQQATNDLLTTLNGYNQTIASGSAAGTNWSIDFVASTLAGSVLTLNGAPAAVGADGGVKLLRVVLSAATLLGTVLGGGAKVYVYHCAGPNDAWNASGAVLLGTYPVASNTSYAVLNGRVVPKGRYLRVQATNGGCAISLDYA